MDICKIGDSIINIFDLEKNEKNATHRNGKVYNIYMGKALARKDDDTIIPEYADDICFEILPKVEQKILSSK